jgi:hypothetical protein
MQLKTILLTMLNKFTKVVLMKLLGLKRENPLLKGDSLLTNKEGVTL